MASGINFTPLTPRTMSEEVKVLKIPFPKRTCRVPRDHRVASLQDLAGFEVLKNMEPSMTTFKVEIDLRSSLFLFFTVFSTCEEVKQKIMTLPVSNSIKQFLDEKRTIFNRRFKIIQVFNFMNKYLYVNLHSNPYIKIDELYDLEYFGISVTNCEGNPCEIYYFRDCDIGLQCKAVTSHCRLRSEWSEIPFTRASEYKNHVVNTLRQYHCE